MITKPPRPPHGVSIETQLDWIGDMLDVIFKLIDPVGEEIIPVGETLDFYTRLHAWRDDRITEGFTIDSHVWPWIAYKGERFLPTDMIRGPHE